MTEFLITPLSPGIIDEKLMKFLIRNKRPFLITSKINELTGFVHEFEGSTTVRSSQGISSENQVNFAHENIEGAQRVIPSHVQAQRNGIDPVSLQEVSSCFPPVVVGASAILSNIFPLRPDQFRPLNAADLLMESPSRGDEDGPDISSEFPAMDSVVKEEVESPLFAQNPPDEQPHKLLLGISAETLMNEEEAVEFRREVSGAIEGIVKEECMDDKYGDSEGVQEQRKKRKETGFPLALQGDVPSDNCASFECENNCKVVFTTQHDLLMHWKTNPKCEDRGLRFSAKKTLPDRRHHVHVGNSAEFACDICGKTLSSKRALERHEKVHSGKRPFECEVCLRCFREKSTLKSHMLTHTGEKPHECEMCQKRFAQKGDLNIHIRTHTGEKPFECPECLKRFADPSAITKHRRRIHGFQKMSD